MLMLIIIMIMMMTKVMVMMMMMMVMVMMMMMMTIQVCEEGKLRFRKPEKVAPGYPKGGRGDDDDHVDD